MSLAKKGGSLAPPWRGRPRGVAVNALPIPPNADGAGDPLGSALFEVSEDCVKVVGLDGRLLAMNANGLCLMEIDDFAALRGRPWAMLWPEAQRSLVEAAVARARDGQVTRFSADGTTAKGNPRSFEVLVSPVFGSDGAPVHCVSISRDVTERLRIEQENAVLVGELAHRIKNMFAVVDGVIGLSARGDNAVAPFVTALRARILSLGRAVAYVIPSHSRAASDVGRHTLHGLLGVLLGPYGDASRIRIAGDDLPVGRTATTSIALVANELATNALKYGALSLADGLVTVTTRQAGTDLEMVWEEQGPAAATAPAAGAAEGFGTLLLENAVTRQLGGRIARDWGPQGLVVSIALPLERLGR